MKALILVGALVGFVPSFATAQTDRRAMMMEDLVSVDDGKWVIEEFSMERLDVPGYEPVEYQLRLYAEVPNTGVMTRDFFVRITYETQAAILLSMLAEAYQTTPSQFLVAYESTPLQAAIGQPDVELSLFMTEEGIQFEWKDTTTGQTNRSTILWDDPIGGEGDSPG